jgi:hypothetical protein
MRETGTERIMCLQNKCEPIVSLALMVKKLERAGCAAGFTEVSPVRYSVVTDSVSLRARGERGLGFALWKSIAMLGRVNQQPEHSANPLIAKVRRLFSRDLALENDCLRQENRILPSKLGSRVLLREAGPRVPVKHGLRIKERLGEVISIARPETLLAWHRRQKQKKWTFELMRGARLRRAPLDVIGPRGLDNEARPEQAACVQQ